MKEGVKAIPIYRESSNKNKKTTTHYDSKGNKTSKVTTDKRTGKTTTTHYDSSGRSSKSESGDTSAQDTRSTKQKILAETGYVAPEGTAKYKSQKTEYESKQAGEPVVVKAKEEIRKEPVVVGELKTVPQVAPVPYSQKYYTDLSLPQKEAVWKKKTGTTSRHTWFAVAEEPAFYIMEDRVYDVTTGTYISKKKYETIARVWEAEAAKARKEKAFAESQEKVYGVGITPEQYEKLGKVERIQYLGYAGLSGASRLVYGKTRAASEWILKAVSGVEQPTGQLGKAGTEFVTTFALAKTGAILPIVAAEVAGQILKPSIEGENWLMYKGRQVFEELPRATAEAVVYEPGAFVGGIAGAYVGGKGPRIKGPIEAKIERKLFEKKYKDYVSKLIKDASPDEARRFKAYFKTAKELDVKTKVSNPNLSKITSPAGNKLSPKAQRVINKWLIEESGKKGQILTGSTATQTQLKLGIKPGDIDVFSALPDEAINRLQIRLKAAGLKVNRVKPHKLKVDGVKIESHSLKIGKGAFAREAFGYLKDPRKTPSGILVTDISEQAARKAVAGIVPGRKEMGKDWPAYERIAPELFKAAEAKARGAVFFKESKLMKVERIKSFYYQRKGTMYAPSISYKPTLPTVSRGLYAGAGAIPSLYKASYTGYAKAPRATYAAGAYPKASYDPSAYSKSLYAPSAEPYRAPRYAPSPEISSYSPSTYAPSKDIYAPSPAMAPRAAPYVSPLITPKVRLIPKVPRIIITRKRKEKRRKKQAYNVFVRESRPKGKAKITWVKINKAPLPRKRAFNAGALYTDRTTSATFQTRRKGTTTLRDVTSRKLTAKFRYKAPKSKITGHPIWIEKNKYRIDTPGEFAGITIKGMLARRGKL